MTYYHVVSVQRPLPANKSLQATRDGALSSASRFTLVGPACLSSGRSPEPITSDLFKSTLMKTLISLISILVGFSASLPDARAAAFGDLGPYFSFRSEERRVGKECRSRW